MPKNTKKIDDTVQVWNLDLFGRTKQDLLIHLKNHLEKGKGLLTVATPNPEQITLTLRVPEFLAALQTFDILLPDGMGLVLSSKLLGWRRGQAAVTERITGVEVVDALCSYATDQKLKVLILGGRGYENLRAYCPAATWFEAYEVAGKPTEREAREVAFVIQKTKPDIVFVAFGAPAQEFWIDSYRTFLAEHKVKLAMAVGGSFDFLLGKVPRAPGWMQQLGLEWAYRLYREPWRWRRQLQLLTFLKLTAIEFFK